MGEGSLTFPGLCWIPLRPPAGQALRQSAKWVLPWTPLCTRGSAGWDMERSIWKERAGPEATGIHCVKFSTYELYKYILYVDKIK